MKKQLIIVESPAKAKSISKYLGKEFKALASYGHVRDLLPKKGAVEPDNDFIMHYEIIDRNRKYVDAIIKEMRTAQALYLATDPDREGEAISWHLLELLKERKALKDIPVYRVEFHEITRSAILNAVANPRKISDNLINAQQARRALDYLVGFNLSPLLWKKVRSGLSAGRVQSPALRMICEREEEVEKFVSREYWTMEADIRADGQPFAGKLTHLDDEKLNQFSITDEKSAAQIRKTLDEAADGTLTVATVKRTQKKRNPAPPFITSTLQQEAARKLRFTTRTTMQVAQQLYEGVNLQGEHVGLISYMRTDSVALASEAVSEIRGIIAREYGSDMLPERPRAFRNKTKNAQEAHEAIRPTSVNRMPKQLKSRLTRDQHLLYDLIWKRTVACQMVHAVIDTVAVDMKAGTRGIFRATGSTIRNRGFMAVYLEGLDDKPDTDAKEVSLPVLNEGMVVDLDRIRPEQHFTEPPPRYNEASLVKTLETYGIGRPSTYASIISTLQNRGYATLENRRFEPTEIGKVVNRFLSSHFSRYVDYEFTAMMEDALDEISRGEKPWIPLMDEFWKSFSSLVEEKEESVAREEVMQHRVLGTDPETGKVLSVRMGRFGPYAQIGTREDEDKPRFASLLPGQKLDTIDFEQALKLFQLPRSLGETPDGQQLSVGIGRYGPYAKYGNSYVSLGSRDPHTIDRETVLELVEEKKIQDANRIILDFGKEGIQVLNGRFGPYITNGKKNTPVPKDIRDPADLTVAQCRELLAKKKPRKQSSAKKKPAGKRTRAKN